MLWRSNIDHHRPSTDTGQWAIGTGGREHSTPHNHFFSCFSTHSPHAILTLFWYSNEYFSWYPDFPVSRSKPLHWRKWWPSVMDINSWGKQLHSVTTLIPNSWVAVLWEGDWFSIRVIQISFKYRVQNCFDAAICSSENSWELTFVLWIANTNNKARYKYLIILIQ